MYYYVVPSEIYDVVINVTSNSSILVQWDPPSHPNGILTYYDVIVFNSFTGFNFSARINASDKREIIVTELGKIIFLCVQCLIHSLLAEPFVGYTVQVFASTEAGRSKAGTELLVFTEHGGNLL